MAITKGMRGDPVRELQEDILALGYELPRFGADGDMGDETLGAVRKICADHGRPVDPDPDVVSDVELAFVRALRDLRRAPTVPAAVDQCDAATWSAFEALVDAITSRPVRYGPGRGLYVHEPKGTGDAGKWVITYGAGKLGGTVREWPNVLGKTYPAFHCTSWCNFFISWLCRRNEDYTHAGNCPDIWDLLLKSPDLHQNPGAGPYRGFGDVCYQIAPDGSGAKRRGVSHVVDMRELYDRRAALPTFVLFGQSTLTRGKWKWWHHTGLFCFRDGRMYRIAADGYHGAKGYSATAMRWVEITPANLAAYDNCVYRVYGVRTADGTYGDPERPIADVTFES